MRDDQFGQDIYLDTLDQYDGAEIEALFSVLKENMSQALRAGFSKVYVQFNSTVDSYDKTTGPVEVQIRGQRNLTEKELKIVAEQKRIQDLATKLEISYYDAATIDRLQKSGKIGL